MHCNGFMKTWEERAKIEKTFLKHFPKYYQLVIAGFSTGLRIGELIALQWQYIDYFNKLIFYKQRQNNNTKDQIKPPKGSDDRTTD